jgi:hypothetical protein
MSTSENDKCRHTVRAIGLVLGAVDFTVHQEDGRLITVPYACYPRLQHADRKNLAHFEIHAEGRMLHWPELDEDIEVLHIIEGKMPVKQNMDLMAVAEDKPGYPAPAK